MKNEIIRFLKGDDSIVVNKVKEEMYKESELLHFEKAKELKDMLESINIVLTRQKVELKDNIDRDIFGYYVDKGYLSIQVLFIRNSKINGHHSKIMPIIEDEINELTRYIAEFYNKGILKPKEILVPDNLDLNLLESYLEIKVKTAIKGEKLKIINMARENAKIALNEQFDLIQRDEAKTVLANNELKELLGLEKLDRIEIFDNAHLFGTYNVSGMVVFIDGKPSKNNYRKFKISIDQNDDYSTMREVIYRRYFKVLKDNLERPDLIIVDGGIGQINVARDVLSSLNMNIMVIGLGKDDKHSTNKLLAYNPIVELPIDKRSNLFYYLERMQDEVHNFTINYHKQIRSKGALSSILDNIEGIGEKRKVELLNKYKTINRLKALSIEELEEILPSKVANNLFHFLQNYE